MTTALCKAKQSWRITSASTQALETARQTLVDAMENLVVVRNAFSRIELEDADAITTGIHSYNNIGIKIEASQDSDEGDTKTDVVANTFNGAWVRFGAMDFGETAPAMFAIRYAALLQHLL